jgi:4-hydroxy-tetrahydrodipicolinate synthase
VLGEVLTAIVTPFQEDGAVAFDRFRALARHLVENGSDGLVVAATTGESPTLTDDEKLELWRGAVDEVGGQATVIAATGTYSTAHSVHLTEKAHDLGVDGFLVVTPYYNKPPAEIANIVAVKQANDDLDQARRIVADTGLDLYAGDDFLVHPFLELGGVGGICVRSNIAGSQFKEMIRRFREGDSEGAAQINQELGPLYELDTIAISPIPIKAAMNLLGQEVGGLRLPLVEATPEERAQVRDCLERAGLLTATPA